MKFDHSWLKEAAFVFLLGIVVVLFIVSTPGCNTQIPKMDVTFWAGDSKKDGISRSQEGKTISCQDPEFDDYVALKYEDVQKIYSTLLQCKQWSNIQLMSLRDKKRFMRENEGVIHAVIEKSPPLHRR